MSKLKFFPNDNSRETIIDANNQPLWFPLYRKTEKTNKKNTTIPRYAGASTNGWLPQYVGLFLIIWFDDEQNRIF